MSDELKLSVMASLILIVMHERPDISIQELIGDDPDGLTAMAELAEKGMISKEP